MGYELLIGQNVVNYMEQRSLRFEAIIIIYLS